MPAANPDQKSQQTLASILYERIRSDIIRGELQPGQKLKIVELTQFYDVGAIPLREALSRLATTGFVESRDQRGFAVRAVSATELVDLTRVRLLIEPAALRESIENGDQMWEERLTHAYQELGKYRLYADQKARKINPDWEAAHDNFHKQLLASCKSPWLIKLTDELRDQTTRYRHISAGSSESPQRNVTSEHKGIFEAAIQRRVELAVVLACEHISTTTSIGVAELPAGLDALRRSFADMLSRAASKPLTSA